MLLVYYTMDHYGELLGDSSLGKKFVTIPVTPKVRDKLKTIVKRQGPGWKPNLLIGHGGFEEEWRLMQAPQCLTRK